MFFVLFLNMKHGKQKVSSPLVGPSCDTQNLVLSELSLLNPSQNFENKIQGLQYIGAPSSSWLPGYGGGGGRRLVIGISDQFLPGIIIHESDLQNILWNFNFDLCLPGIEIHDSDLQNILLP